LNYADLIKESQQYFEENPHEEFYFKLIDSWKEEDDLIQLNYLIPRSANREIKYFLNRQRKSRGWNNERGVEIPINLAKDIGMALYFALPRKTGKTEQKGDWFFDLMKPWHINQLETINLKLMYLHTGETKYFLNKQYGTQPDDNQGGVEIPLSLAKRIGSKLNSL
jgi:hypothetical protein